MTEVRSSGVPEALKLPGPGEAVVKAGQVLEHVAFPLPHLLVSNWRALWEDKPALLGQLVGNAAEITGVGMALFGGLPVEGVVVAGTGRMLSMFTGAMAEAAFRRRHGQEAETPLLARTPEAVMRLGIKVFAPTLFSADVHTPQGRAGVHAAMAGEAAITVAMVLSLDAVAGLYVGSRTVALWAEMKEKGDGRVKRQKTPKVERQKAEKVQGPGLGQQLGDNLRTVGMMTALLLDSLQARRRPSNIKGEDNEQQ
jgi:hypothetical protein